ncbi:MAG TPA: DUF480 domain-containing protein [Fibrobacteria bacterium]|nr:DUF480 domain-containing protein [Fibrobacteria bacterium]
MDALTDLEIRILGTLVEKSMATPEYYPLTLKSLRAGCNQATNRQPVTDYEELDVELGIKALKLKGLVHFIEPKGGHEVRKYQHTLFEEHRWGMNRGQVALFGLLLLRGEQTASELRTRAREKMIDLSPQQTDDALETLVAAQDSPIARVPRQPGQREPRWRFRVGLAEQIDPSSFPNLVDADSDELPILPSSSATVAELEELRRRVAELEQRIRALESKGR